MFEKSPILLSIGAGGAGTLGPAEVGALKALLEQLPIITGRKVQVTDVAGVSAGSIVAALYAMGYSPAEMVDITVDADFSKLIDYNIVDMFFTQCLASNKNVMAWLSALTSNKQMKDVNIPLTTVTTDIDTGRPHAWTSDLYPEMYIKDAIYSSMAIPFIFPEYLGKYVDGGATRNIPVQYLNGKNKILLTVNDGPKERVIKGFYQKAERLLSILLSDDDVLLDNIASMSKVPVIKIPTGNAGFLERNMPKQQKLDLVQAGEKAITDFLTSEGGMKWVKRLTLAKPIQQVKKNP